MKHSNITEIAVLILAIAYIVIPYDMDKSGWYGYIDDFFVFMAAYLYFFGGRNIRPQLKRLLRIMAGCFFITAMLCLIALIILS